MRERGRIVPGAEPFRFDGGPLGALLLHGFTGCPASLRPTGEWLAAQGLTVLGPRLPGHGTHWEDLAGTTWRDWEAEALRSLEDLAARCPDVVVVGLSMGGALALHLAATRPDQVRGVAVVNPAVHDWRLRLVPLVGLFTRTIKAIGNDIKRPGQDELAYDRIPVRSIASLRQLQRVVVGELPQVRCPLLVFRSPQDHVVKPSNARLVMDRVGSEEKELVLCPNSYHVATLDHDADMIRERILEFARAHARSAA